MQKKEYETTHKLSNFDTIPKARVQILDDLRVRAGLGLVQHPPDELDPVHHPGHLALDVGAVHAQLGGGLEARLNKIL